MKNVRVRKRGKYYEYQFDIAKKDGKRRAITKSEFTVKSEAERAGIKAYNEYINTGQPFKLSDMSYNDYLDYWVKSYC